MTSTVVTNEQRVGQALYYFNDGARPFIETVLRSLHGERWLVVAFESVNMTITPKNNTLDTFDSYQLLQCIQKLWDSAFNCNSQQLQALHKSQFAWFAVEQTIGFPRNLLFEIRGVRNKWAHQALFNNEDSYRALDSIQKFLRLVSALREAEEVCAMRDDVVLLMAHDVQQRRQQQPQPIHHPPHLPPSSHLLAAQQQQQQHHDENQMMWD